MVKQELIRRAPQRSAAAISTLESSAASEFIGRIHAAIPVSEAFVVSTLPQGINQIVQSNHPTGPMVRGYARDGWSDDRLTWRAIENSGVLRDSDCWPNQTFERSVYYREFLTPHRFRHVAAAAVTAPVFEGYPGALHLCRTAAQGAFNSDELSKLASLASEFDAAISQGRAECRTTDPVQTEKRKQTGGRRFYVFDQNLHALPVGGDPKLLEEYVRKEMIERATQHLQKLNGRLIAHEQVALHDSNRDSWDFHIAVYRNYPALGDGPFIFFCQLPDIGDWSALRPSDFQADKEVSRLIPAIRFMETEFSHGPKLGAIAKQVHLSPFHFHRQFTERLGITPKRFLLDCQIDLAKKGLLARQDDLKEIARACGFAHQSHFTSRFKQATGLTPTAWRKFAVRQAAGG